MTKALEKALADEGLVSLVRVFAGGTRGVLAGVLEGLVSLVPISAGNSKDNHNNNGENDEYQIDAYQTAKNQKDNNDMHTRHLKTR